MKDSVKVIYILILSLVGFPAFAQFSIKDTPKAEIPMATEEKRDSILPVKGYQWDYVNDAERLLRKKARRKERNLFELEAKASLSQTSFENWASGGDNTLNARFEAHVKHEYKIEKFVFETKFDTKYGFNYIEKERFKNEDEFKLNFKSNWKMHDNWSLSQDATLRSQYTIGHNNRKDTVKRSAFMAPGYLDLSVGVTYKKRPLTILISPIGGNARFVLDKELSDNGQHGVDKGKRAKWQAGPSVKITFEDEYFNKVLRVKSEAYSFSNLNSDPTLDWRTTITIWATKFLSTTLYAQVMYDQLANTPKPQALQYKYGITLDLVYKFRNK